MNSLLIIIKADIDTFCSVTYLPDRFQRAQIHQSPLASSRSGECSSQLQANFYAEKNRESPCYPRNTLRYCFYTHSRLPRAHQQLHLPSFPLLLLRHRALPQRYLAQVLSHVPRAPAKTEGNRRLRSSKSIANEMVSNRIISGIAIIHDLLQGDRIYLRSFFCETRYIFFKASLGSLYAYPFQTTPSRADSYLPKTLCVLQEVAIKLILNIAVEIQDCNTDQSLNPPPL